MNHDSAAPLLPEYIAERLGPADVSSVDDHVRECLECTEMVSTLHIIQEQFGKHGAALLEPHPSSDEIVRFTTGTGGLSSERHLQIAAHVRACPTCRAEVDLTRSSDGRASGWQRLREWWTRSTSRPVLRFVPRVAMASLLVLLGGHFIITRWTSLQPSTGGEVGRPVFLPPPSMAGDEIPEYRLTRETRFQSLLVPHDVSAGRSEPGHGLLEFRILRLPERTLVFHQTKRVRDLWGGRGYVVLAPPSEKLTPGTFRVEIEDPSLPGPEYVGDFRIIE